MSETTPPQAPKMTAEAEPEPRVMFACIDSEGGCDCASHEREVLAEVVKDCASWGEPGLHIVEYIPKNWHEHTIATLQAQVEALRGERDDAVEALATIAGVNGYAPGETFPRAMRKNNRFRATVDEVGKLMVRAREQ